MGSSDRRALEDIVKTQVKAVLVDIEGTTTPISFVTQVLFPYIQENVETYLTNNWNDAEVQADVEALRSLSIEDLALGTKGVPAILADGEEGVLKSVVKNVKWQISQDRKTTALKQLQGHMWRYAYEDGSIKGEIYHDVPNALELLKKDGKILYVYSSGSVEAQKLLFGYSDKGDLCHLFSGYFDTKIGHKRETASYVTIAKSIKLNPEDVLFLTDVYAEAKAAKNANMKACILLRPGNKQLSKDELKEFMTIKSFDELFNYEPKAKLRKDSEAKDVETKTR